MNLTQCTSGEEMGAKLNEGMRNEAPGEEDHDNVIRTITLRPPPGLSDPACVERLQVAQAKVRAQDGFGATILRELLEMPGVMDVIEHENDGVAERIRDCVAVRSGWYEEWMRALTGKPSLDQEVWVNTFRSK